MLIRCLVASLVLVLAGQFAALAAAQTRAGGQPQHASEQAPRASAGPVPILLSGLAAGQAPRFSVVLGASDPALTVEQVAAAPRSQHEPFDASKAYAQYGKEVMWLHFRVQAQKRMETRRWVLEFPKPYVNQIDFFFRDASDAWQSRSAGVLVPKSVWSQRGLWPRFELPELQEGVHDFYVRILKESPMPLPARLLPAEAADALLQEALFSAGLMLGMVVLLGFSSAALAVVFRDTIYAWYAGYVALTCIAAFGYCGVAKLIFWPEATDWAAQATPLIAMAALGTQLIFCRLMFLALAPSRFWDRLSLGWVGTTVGMMVVASIIQSFYLTVLLCLITTVITMLLMMILVLRTMPVQRDIALLWLLAYLPLTLILALTLLNVLAPVSFSWLPDRAPIYAMVFEVPLLLLALHIHAKRQHAQRVHGSVLSEVHPATGFVRSSRFQHHLSSMWDRARRTKTDLAVAYVGKESGAPAEAPGKPQAAPMDTMLARCLRTVARSKDTVAHVNDQTVALLMPGMPPGEGLETLLARLVTLDQAQAFDLSRPVRQRLTVVATTIRTFSGTWQEVHTDLLDASHRARAGEGTPVRLLRKEPEPEPCELDQLWQQALRQTSRSDQATGP